MLQTHTQLAISRENTHLYRADVPQDVVRVHWLLYRNMLMKHKSTMQRKYHCRSAFAKRMQPLKALHERAKGDNAITLAHLLLRSLQYNSRAPREEVRGNLVTCSQMQLDDVSGLAFSLFSIVAFNDVCLSRASSRV